MDDITNDSPDLEQSTSAQVDDGSTAVDSTPAVADDAPKTMLEAMFKDEQKPAEASVTPEVKHEAAKTEEKPVVAEDVTQMPEGLSAKAQERFQKLANTNKELSAQHEKVLSTIEPFRVSLQENAVTSEQFDSATKYIGLINKGDLQGALRVMDEERRKISLMLGQSLPGVDALEEFPDLRGAVDQFQMTEQAAIEMARFRAQQAQQQKQQQQVQYQQQQQQQSQQARDEGLKAIDAFERKMKASDLDYARIEAMLLPKMQQIVNGLPPHMWAAHVENAYNLIKSAAGASRQSSAQAPLRPTGAASPSSAPKNMFEAMFGGGQ